ncbi:Hypothetical protein RMP42_05795 [Roseomonas mucosa]|nr:Hypothetical protein RMP42_05795 [Roseomonas mucosa]
MMDSQASVHTANAALYVDTFAKLRCTLRAAVRVKGCEAEARTTEGRKVLLDVLLLPEQPVRSPNSDAAVLEEAMRRAQETFAELDCRPPRHEDLLTGALLARVSSGLLEANSRWQEALGDDHEPVHLWSVDLISGDEQRLGSDFALILETTDRLVTVCYQAKRGHVSEHGSKTVSISSPKRGKDGSRTDHLWQLRRLVSLELGETGRGSGIATAYVFYDNADGTVEHPILPVAKKSLMAMAELGLTTEDLKKESLRAGPEGTRSVKLHADTMDLATHLAATVSDPQAGLERSPDSLQEIAHRLVQEKVSRIAAVSTCASFVEELRLAFPEPAFAVSGIPTTRAAFLRDWSGQQQDVGAEPGMPNGIPGERR